MSFIDSIKRSDLKNKAIIFTLCGMSVIVSLMNLILWAKRYNEIRSDGIYELTLHYRYYLISSILLLASILLFITNLIFCCKKKYGVYLLLTSIALLFARIVLIVIKEYKHDSVFFEIVRAVGYLLLAVSALNGFTNKKLFYLSICLTMLASVARANTGINIVIVYDIVWFVFGFSNTIPPLIGVKRSDEAMKMEALKYKLDEGIITKEQYDEQRKEIIDNL